MVELMVGANASPLIKSASGETAHSLAANRHRVALVIAEASAIHAMAANDMPALLESIEHGAYVNIHNAAGWTPLIFATATGNEEAVKFMLRHGAEPDRQENDGWTALHFAASTGNARLVSLLLEANASPAIRSGEDGLGMTPRELAAEQDFPEILDLIPAMAEQEL
jgi:ankyrin repeat protein